MQSKSTWESLVSGSEKKMRVASYVDLRLHTWFFLYNIAISTLVPQTSFLNGSLRYLQNIAHFK